MRCNWNCQWRTTKANQAKWHYFSARCCWKLEHNCAVATLMSAGNIKSHSHSFAIGTVWIIARVQQITIESLIDFNRFLRLVVAVLVVWLLSVLIWLRYSSFTQKQRQLARERRREREKRRGGLTLWGLILKKFLPVTSRSSLLPLSLLGDLPRTLAQCQQLSEFQCLREGVPMSPTRREGEQGGGGAV